MRLIPRLVFACATVGGLGLTREAAAQALTLGAVDTAARRANEPLPLAPTRRIAFTTTEGTWLSLDVSRDGRTIVFDLLGDLYTLPITGGTARRITSGPAFDAQPRWSPDGKQLVFLSDWDGVENVWTSNADGTRPRQVSRVSTGVFASQGAAAAVAAKYLTRSNASVVTICGAGR